MNSNDLKKKYGKCLFIFFLIWARKQKWYAMQREEWPSQVMYLII